MSNLLHDIEAFLTANEARFSATAFGDAALGDRHLVRQMRAGRRVWPETERKIREFMVRESHQDDAPSERTLAASACRRAG